LRWWLYSLILVAVVGILGYLRIDLSAKILSTVTVLEIGVVLIFDAAVGVDGGPQGLSASPFSWGSFSSGTVGVAVLFAVITYITYIGFEATAIFREETKTPRTTIPRAMSLGAVHRRFLHCGDVAAHRRVRDVEGCGGRELELDGNVHRCHRRVRRQVGQGRHLRPGGHFGFRLSCQNIISRYGFDSRWTGLSRRC